MPFSILRIGTSYAGLEREEDGRFIATSWLVFLGIPLAPLHSRVVADVSVETAQVFLFTIRRELAVDGSDYIQPVRRRVSRAYWKDLGLGWAVFAALLVGLAGLGLITKHTEGFLTVFFVLVWLSALGGVLFKLCFDD
jgi:hypothetical protein